MGIVQYAILNDIHFPYEGICYYEALKLMESWPSLKQIYLNGDIAEVESVSKHPKGPKAQKIVQEELDIVNKHLDNLQNRFPEIPVTYIEGNHEYRLFRYIRDICPEMWGLIDCPSLLKFPDRPLWKFITYGPSQLVKVGKAKDLYCRHEPYSCAQASHHKFTAEKSMVSIIYGHMHVYAVSQHKKYGPEGHKTVMAMANGWLGDISKECFNYRGTKENWQNGFTRIDCDEETGEYEIRFQFL